MALVEGCKHSLEISVPVDEVETETDRVVAAIQQKAKLPGFRPGKVPLALVRKNFQADVRQKVLEALIPRHLEKRIKEEDLNLIGQPDITKVKLDAGEPLEFTAEFEVSPEIELQQYKGVTVHYHDPEVTDEDISKRLEEIRDRKADFSNVDPRPVEDGDYVVVSLASVGGVEGDPVKLDDMTLHIGGPDTMEAFTVNLLGMTPGESKEFEVGYPEGIANQRLAGRTVRFHATLKTIRRKELPDLNDEFARDLGDYQSLEELKEAIRRSIYGERQFAAQQEAKSKLVDSLVDMHQFPVPEAYVNRQIQNRVERSLQQLAAEGKDVSKLKLDWNKVKEAQKDQAVREVKASMLLDRIGERETIVPTREEVDREIERFARQQREPIAAVRMRFEKDGTIGRIASQIQTDKTLNFLFEHARKEAE